MEIKMVLFIITFEGLRNQLLKLPSPNIPIFLFNQNILIDQHHNNKNNIHQSNTK